MTDEYYMRICERDALWEAFCKFPSDNNWDRYVEACEAVNAVRENKAASFLEGEG